MNPYQCRVVLRPRGPLEVLDLSFRFLRERLGPFARLAVPTLLPTWVVVSLAAWWFEGHWVILLPTLIFGAALRASFTALAGRLLFAEDVRVVRVLADVAARTPGLLAVWLTGLVGWVVAALTCFVALPWIQGALLYLVQTALLERVPVGRGVRRTLRLVSGRPGHALAGALGTWALVVWSALVGEGVGQALVGFVLQLGQPFGSLWTGQVTPWLLGGVLLGQPLVAVFRFLLYVDVRTRIEGWDLQVGLRAAGLSR